MVDFHLLHVIIIWKAMTLTYNLAYQETILGHPEGRQIFAGKPYPTFYNIWDLLLWKFKYQVRLSYQVLFLIKNQEVMPEPDFLLDFYHSSIH